LTAQGSFGISAGVRHRVLVLSTVLTFGALATVGFAHAATPWKPGTNYLVSEDDMNRLLEKSYDQASCQGIPRFGHRAETQYKYEAFIYFDCSTERNGVHCFDYRWRAVKAQRRGYFQARLVRRGTCY
jgi:hypothetical protein